MTGRQGTGKAGGPGGGELFGLLFRETFCVINIFLCGHDNIFVVSQQFVVVWVIAII